MSVLNGFTKYKNYKADSSGDHKKVSYWTSSDTVEGSITQASTRENLTNEETLSSSLGKIKKWFADLGTAAFKSTTDSYDGTSSDPITGKGVKAAIEGLDVNEVGGSGKYISAISEVDGKISATAGNIDSSVTQNSSNLVTSGAVWTAIDNLPEPLVFKGTLGAAADNPTITSLPTASSSNEGWTYLVVTDGTYASQAAKVGDKFACATFDSGTTYQWIWFKAGDPDTDTWRNIKVNGTEKLGNGISSGGVDFVNGTNTTVSFNATGNKIKVDATDTTYSTVSKTADGLCPQLPNETATTKFLRQDGSWAAPAGDITGGGTSGRLTKWNGASSITDGPALSSAISTQTQSTKFLREDGTWSAPSYTTDTNTWRKVQLNGTDKLGTGTNTNPLNLKAGTNVSITESSGTFTFSATDTTYGNVSSSAAGLAPKGAAVSSQSQSTKFLREDGSWAAPSYTTNTDTKVTSSANHYSPSTASGQDKTASATGATAAWSIDVVKGVTLNTDGKGHVTGLSVTSGKIPANPNTDTKNTAGADNTTSKIFLVGPTAQTTNNGSARTYSNANCYASGGLLYSNGEEVVTLAASQALTNKTYNGYTLKNACAKSVVTTADDMSLSGYLPTTDAVVSYLNTNYFNISNRAVSSNAISKNVTGGTLDMVIVQRIGKLVIASARIYNLSIAASQNFFKLAEGYRPTSTVYGLGFMLISDIAGSQSVFCTVNIDGTVSLTWSASKTCTQVGFFAVFYTE